MWNSLKDRGSRLRENLLYLLFPSVCPNCGSRADSVEFFPLCGGCWTSIKRYMCPSCRICAMPFNTGYPHICGDCISNPPAFSSVHIYGIYSDVLATAINLMKFSGIKRLSRPLARLLMDLDIPDADVVIPVPMTKKSLLKRGFNQSLLIAREISKRKSIPLDIDSLQKIKETLPQVGLKAEERTRNLRGVFSVTGEVKGKEILLIDDVMTTGTTLRECSKAILKAGAAKVRCLVIARTSLE